MAEGESTSGTQAAGSKHEPVVTRRPAFHPVVQALEAPDAGAAFAQLVRDHLAPGKWAVDTESGFWWVPYRLMHKIELLGDEVQHRTLCRSDFVLLENIDPEDAVGLTNYLNERPFGATVWCDLDSGSVHATTTVVLEPAAWWNAFVFLNAVTRLVGICENVAPRLAERWGGRVPQVVHPEFGLREEPDGFLSEHFHITLQPEAATGVWFAGREIESMRRSLQSMLASEGYGSAASMLADQGGYDRRLTAIGNFRADFELPVGGTTASVSVRQADHPDLGRGLEFFIGTQVTAERETDPALTASSSFEALYLANALNQAQVAFCPLRLSAGGWSAWGSQLSASTFIDGETVRQLVGLCDIAAGETVAMMAADQSGVLTILADALRPEVVEVPWEPQEPVWWDGVETNAGLVSLLVDDATVISEVTEGLPVNAVLEPVPLEGDAWALQHSDLLATFGIFNPAGPSVGSLEVAVNYSSGLALLLERTRHPLHPSLRLHAVLDRDGYDDLASYVEAALADMPWFGLDWFEIIDGRPALIDALRRGLRVFGSNLDIDLNTETRLIVASVASPWDRLEHPDELLLPDLPTGDPQALWAEAIQHPSNIDSHVAYLRSAWEASIEWALGDNGRASQTAGRLSDEIRLREGGR